MVIYITIYSATEVNLCKGIETFAKSQLLYFIFYAGIEG